MTIITCKKCKKEFSHFRHTFPKNYEFHCAWCDQKYTTIEECHFPDLKFKEKEK